MCTVETKLTFAIPSSALCDSRRLFLQYRDCRQVGANYIPRPSRRWDFLLRRLPYTCCLKTAHIPRNDGGYKVIGACYLGIHSSEEFVISKNPGENCSSWSRQLNPRKIILYWKYDFMFRALCLSIKQCQIYKSHKRRKSTSSLR
jgi:hypothetical protein